MKILAINAGSSSLKFQLFLMPDEKIITKGLIERIGFDDAIVTLKYDGKKIEKKEKIKDHVQACKILLDLLIENNIIKDYSEIKAIGHRVVQGGEYFKNPVVLDDVAISKIDELSILAPLHNPTNLVGIKAFLKTMPNQVQVACFDTTFHSTIPKENYTYAVPYSWYKDYMVRKYGFHGISHEYVSKSARKILGDKKSSKLIVCHLGNGISLTAIHNGKSIDTTMGLTPLDGIPMGTRSGSIDPGILEYINKMTNKSVSEIVKDLNKSSGLLGVSGISSDSRDVIKAMREGNEIAKLALDIQVKRICDYIGSYYVLLGGLDAIVFTAGIGENSVSTRKSILEKIEFLGLKVDYVKNSEKISDATFLTKKSSKIKALVIPTNEELMIAKSTYELAKGKDCE